MEIEAVDCTCRNETLDHLFIYLRPQEFYEVACDIDETMTNVGAPCDPTNNAVALLAEFPPSPFARLPSYVSCTVVSDTEIVLANTEPVRGGVVLWDYYTFELVAINTKNRQSTLQLNLWRMITNPDAVAHDLIEVTGSATIGDTETTLKVSLLDGFMPSFGDEFTVLTAAGEVSGMFETVDDSMAALTGGLAWEVSCGTNDIVLTVVPESAGMLLALLGTLTLVARIRRY